MTSGIRRAAGGLLIVEAVWVFYAQIVAVPVFACPSNGCPGPGFNPVYSQALLVFAAILIVDGLIGIWGSWFAYPAGALLSMILLLVMGYSAWIDVGYTYLVGLFSQDLVGAALAGIALLVNLVAWRTKYALSEQANPMNLPVFG